MSPFHRSLVKRITFYLLTNFLFLVGLLLWFIRFGAGEGNRVYAVEFSVGTSMEPVIHDGDLLIISRLGGGSLKPGMIVAFESPEGKRFLHRIIAIKKNGCVITKGDNNPANDEWNFEGKVIREICQIDGILAMNIPKLGHLYNLFQNLLPWNRDKGP